MKADNYGGNNSSFKLLALNNVEPATMKHNSKMFREAPNKAIKRSIYSSVLLKHMNRIPNGTFFTSGPNTEARTDSRKTTGHRVYVKSGL